jgi:hypothetical protein
MEELNAGTQRPGPVPLADALAEAEWVADLLGTYGGGDLDRTIADLESLLTRLRPASKARRVLREVPPKALGDALTLRSLRGETS